MSRSSSAGARGIGLIGVPSGAGSRAPGHEQAPRRLRDLGLVEKLRAAGLAVPDLGDLEPVPYAPDLHPANAKRRNLPSVLRSIARVKDAVDSALGSGYWPLVVGGDCTITIGILASLVTFFPDIGLIYVDGDLDMNTPATTPSGFFDGMGLAHIVGHGEPALSRCAARFPIVGAEAVVPFGYSVEARGVDPAELALLGAMRMRGYAYSEVNANVTASATQALYALSEKVGHLLVHVDVDVLDSSQMQAVDFPHNPALRVEQVEAALRVFLSSPLTVGLAVTEYNPLLDPEGIAGARIVALLQNALSERT